MCNIAFKTSHVHLIEIYNISKGGRENYHSLNSAEHGLCTVPINIVLDLKGMKVETCS